MQGMTTTFNEADHPRGDAGKFETKQRLESGVELIPDPSAKLAAQLEDLDAELYREMLRLDERRSDAQLAYQRVSLKTLGAGLKKEYPNARYLRLSEDSEHSNEYWVEGLTDADGNSIPAKSDNLAEESLLHDNGHQVLDMVGNLTRRSVRWMEGVTDDNGELAKFGQGGEFINVDLDKAAALELGGKPTVETRTLAADEQLVLTKAAEDGLYYLQDIVEERADDYSKSDLEDIEDRISAIARLLDPED